MSKVCAVTLDGTTYEIESGENLLAGLTSNGVIVPHSCLAGACRSCCLYEATTTTPLLACQQRVTEDLSLMTQAHHVYDVVLEHVTVSELTQRWAVVTGHTKMALPLGADIRWQCGGQEGRSTCCSPDGTTLDFYFPTHLCNQIDTLKLVNKPQRALLDPNATFLLLYGAKNEPMARHFAEALTASNLGTKIELALIDLSKSDASLSFKRFDMAVVMADESISLHALETWLTNSRCRVNEFTYLINHS